jgi:O-antigen ligase
MLVFGSCAYIFSFGIDVISEGFNKDGGITSAGFDQHEALIRVHSINSRLVMWKLSLDSISSAPFLGNGMFSFSGLYPEAPAQVGAVTFKSAWISNLPLAILHDTGVVGFILFFTFVGMVVVNGWRCVRHASINKSMSQTDINIGAALLAGLVALLVSSLTAPAHSLAHFWVVLALMARFNIISNKSKAISC